VRLGDGDVLDLDAAFHGDQKHDSHIAAVIFDPVEIALVEVRTQDALGSIRLQQERHARFTVRDGLQLDPRHRRAADRPYSAGAQLG